MIDMRSSARPILAAIFVMVLVACAPHVRERDTAVFSHNVQGNARPWTAAPPDSGANRFRFAVFSDLTGGEREGIFEIAIAQLNLLRPDLIVNVGDLVEGGEDRAQLDAQWDFFDVRARRAQAPVFYTGGNHDLLGEEMRKTWEARYGARHYHFVYRDVLFLVLDTEDYADERLREVERMRTEAIEVAETQGWDAFAKTPYARMPEDETGFVSQEQAEEMVRALGDHADVRWTFLLMHKAPWAAEEMPAWRAIEAALQGRPYTVFHGHRHAYRYERRGSGDYIRLATTGGVQLPHNGRSMDQVVLVTVDEEGAHIANLLMNGILDKTGRVPLEGDAECFEKAVCGEPRE